jgi:acetylornithine deacetylase
MEKLNIIKIGGHVIDDDQTLQQFLNAFTAIEGKKILVHGGGKVASGFGKRLGIEPKIIDGRRITDAATLEIVVMVYAGLINKKVVAQLQAQHCNAIGLCGADATIITSEKRIVKDIDYGFVGDVVPGKINTSFLEMLLSKNITPVISSITHNGEGQLLNTNADTIASELAVALSSHYKVQLNYCFEKPGVLRNVNDDATLITQITSEEYKDLKFEGLIYSGMIPKLDNAFRAIEQGIECVKIGSSARLNELVDQKENAGTKLVWSRELGVESKKSDDPINSKLPTLDSKLAQTAIELLQQLIAIPSFSTEEHGTADLLEHFFKQRSIPVNRKLNNIWGKSKNFDPLKPTILLNSHHDTVKPSSAYTLDPFLPVLKDGKLYGLGSNDAGASLVSLLVVFLHFYDKDHLTYNFIFAASAEEENSGMNGIEILIPELGKIDLAIVGEPTQMHLAIAEKGLLVIDCMAKGSAGHAARDEGDNAIYRAMKDIEWFRTFRFPKVSETLGEIKMNVTMMEAGTQHNMIPSGCSFTVDIRCTDVYTHEELLEIIKQNVDAEIQPRSLRLRPSFISMDHPFVKAGITWGRKTYGSPTTSDQALMPYTSVKMGPGDSARSHTADEFIYLREIEEGITIYIQLLDQLNRI